MGSPRVERNCPSRISVSGALLTLRRREPAEAEHRQRVDGNKVAAGVPAPVPPYSARTLETRSKLRIIHTRQREGRRRAPDPLHPRILLRRSKLHVGRRMSFMPPPQLRHWKTSRSKKSDWGSAEMVDNGSPGGGAAHRIRAKWLAARAHSSSNLDPFVKRLRAWDAAR
jgi:hypothetical protein